MKIIYTFIAIAFSTLLMYTPVCASEKSETKKACVTTKDAKTGKNKEQCKTIKIHKKLESSTPEKRK
jgi:hypothetical protein